MSMYATTPWRQGVAIAALGLALLSTGCAGHSAHTEDARKALDRGDPQEALALLNERLEVDSSKELPDKIEPDDHLFILDRSTVLQWVGDYAHSSRDLETADKGIEILDFSRSTADDIGKYLFSDDTGAYQAPAYEKLMINTMNMMNYLARRDLNGARIEARRFAVMQKFIAEHEDQGKALSGPGSYLAGFIFEKSKRADEALLYYDEALKFAEYHSLQEPVARLAKISGRRSPRIEKILEQGPAQAPDGHGDLLVMVNFGRVPAKEAKRIPIGLALTMAAGSISPDNTATANRLAAQGLVTWVNYPVLGKARGQFGRPGFWLDQRPQALERMLAVDAAAQQEWKSIEGVVIASAITRLITRLVAGEATNQVAGGGLVGSLLSLGTQATMSAMDTPDTRSWSTLPARVAFGRLRLPPGQHEVRLVARGETKRQKVTIEKGGWAVVMLTVLR